MTSLADLVLTLSGPVATALLAYIGRVTRRVDRRLDDVEDHERALFGDPDTNWPGLMSVVDDVALTDGGEHDGDGS